MKLKLIAAVLLAAVCSVSAQDTSIQTMLKNCEQAMLLGSCSVVRDEKNYPPNTPGPVIAGYGRVPLIPYIRLQNQQGFMCPYAEMACSKDAASDVCKVAMALWGSR